MLLHAAYTHELSGIQVKQHGWCLLCLVLLRVPVSMVVILVIINVQRLLKTGQSLTPDDLLS